MSIWCLVPIAMMDVVDDELEVVDDDVSQYFELCSLPEKVVRI